MSDTLTILDVGHGNAAIVSVGDWIVVVDAGPGTSILEFLTASKIAHISEIIVSHADEDHIGGLMAILSSGRFTIGTVRLNSDSSKSSKIWDDLVVALDDAGTSGSIDFQHSISCTSSPKLGHGNVAIEFLSPSAYLATKGPGGKDRKGRTITTNSISAVVRIIADGAPVALLGSDLDQVGLDEIKHGVSKTMTADFLVFPHHGGRSGSGATDAAAFTSDLLALVSPKAVVFSIGRGKHGTPRPEIVAAIRATASSPRIVCTQLSLHCASNVPSSTSPHLLAAYAKGRVKNHCCGGTIQISLSAVPVASPTSASHQLFIDANAPTALCRR